MIGELQVSFFLHPVSVEMRVVSHLPVFLQHLRRIAPRPAVNPVELLAALLTIVSAPPAAVVSAIVVQG
jgi:hypothetical protein